MWQVKQHTKELEKSPGHPRRESLQAVWFLVSKWKPLRPLFGNTRLLAPCKPARHERPHHQTSFQTWPRHRMAGLHHIRTHEKPPSSRQHDITPYSSTPRSKGFTHISFIFQYNAFHSTDQGSSHIYNIFQQAPDWKPHPHRAAQISYQMQHTAEEHAVTEQKAAQHNITSHWAISHNNTSKITTGSTQVHIPCNS